MINVVGQRVLVEPFEIETAPESGIQLIVNEDRELAGQEYGELVGVGPDAWKDFSGGKPWAKIGDKVIYSKYGGKFVKEPNCDKKYVVLNDEDILAILED
jgi:co-chaperonin GroES (HSP10)